MTITSGAGGTQSMSGGPGVRRGHAAFNGGPYGAEVKEPSAFVGFKYDVTERMRLFTQAMYGASGIEPVSPARPAASAGHLVRARSTPATRYLPAALQQAMTQQGVMAFKMPETRSVPGLQNWADDQTDHNVHTMFTWSVGGEADLWSDWQAEARTGRQAARTSSREVMGDLRVDRMFLALDAVTGPNGTPICRVQRYNPTPAQLAAAPSVQGQLNKFGDRCCRPSGLDNTISGCVPLDPFGQGKFRRLRATI